MVKQQTIKQECTLSGSGLHTGQKVNMTFVPAAPNHGIKFRRIDLEDLPLINADVDNVIDTSRGTTLEQHGAKVGTVEHVMAALTGLEIDNVLIEIDAEETPIMDGSSIEFVQAFLNVGIVEQNEERHYFELTENIHYTDTDNNVEIMAVPADEYKITAMIDFNSPVLGAQHAHFDSITQFKDEFADARTFCFLHELELLLDNNLIKGGELNNAIAVVDRVIHDDEMDRLAAMFNRPKVEIKKEGILNNVELRHQNEPARHKLLDVVGDLALIGVPLKAKIIAYRPGHGANVEFGKKIKKHIKKVRKTVAPRYNPDLPPICDIRTITKSLPHKYPFLLVDKIIEMSETHIVGIKNVTYNEHFFQGHFPDNPVMPGVLQIEAMAQTGGILVLSTLEAPEKYDTYFLKIDQARFKYVVTPGDTLILKLELLSPIRRGICEMKGTAFVGSKLACEAVLVAKVFKR